MGNEGYYITSWTTFDKMTKEDLIQNSKRIMKTSEQNPHGGLVEAQEFLRIYAGEDSSFYKTLEQLGANNYDTTKTSRVNEVLSTFIDFVDNNLLRSLSLEREIQIDTVSDYLEQAESLLNDKKVHPAAPAVIIGASLEEFLRN